VVMFGAGKSYVTSTEPPKEELCQVYTDVDSTVTEPPNVDECQSAFTLYDNIIRNKIPNNIIYLRMVCTYFKVIIFVPSLSVCFWEDIFDVSC